MYAETVHNSRPRPQAIAQYRARLETAHRDANRAGSRLIANNLGYRLECPGGIVRHFDDLRDVCDYIERLRSRGTSGL